MSRRRLEGLAVGGLLLAFGVQAIASMRLLTATSDETSHLPAGYTYLATGDLRLNRQHPPLVKMLCAAPLLALRPHLDLQDAGWTSDPPDEWGFGYRFLYSNDADRLLFFGRLPVVLLGLLLGVYVHRWARDLFGAEGGLLALVLYAFSPNLIAHARFVTMDMALSCFATMFLYHLWRRTVSGGNAHLLGAGAGLGLALASKFSAVLFLPALVLLPAAAVAPRLAPGAPSRALRRELLASLVIAAVAAVIVWAVYLFPADPLFYWKGLLTVNKDRNPEHAYYLMGEFRKAGFWYYFLAAMAFKTPLPTLALLGTSAALFPKLKARPIDEAFLVLPGVVFLVGTSALAANLGLRYVLPLYPLAFVFCGRLARWLLARRLRIVLAAGLAVWYIAGTLAIYPDHLAYFNEAAGGPSRGFELLDDSNVDWGQDLERLATYLDEHRIDRVRLLYAWNGSPDYYGIRFDKVTPEDWYGKPRPGLYAVSTMWLIHGRRAAGEKNARSDWLDRYQPVDRLAYSFWFYRFD